MAEQVNTLIYENILKIKKIVIQNKDILQSLRTNFDRPEMMRELCKRLESIYIYTVVLQQIQHLALISFYFRCRFDFG